MRRADSLASVDQALRMNVPVGPDHEFFTDFSGLRGVFEEKVIYRSLNVRKVGGKLTYSYADNVGNKSLIFLGGMRGTGKTSELLSYQAQLNHPDCFFVVFCSLDNELNKNDMEYVDILILQLEQLTLRLKEEDIKIDSDALDALYAWFSERIGEMNRRLDAQAEMEIGGGVNKGGFLSGLLGLFASLKANVTAGTERTTTIRTVLRQNFNPLRDKFNEFVGEAALSIRKRGLAQDILFIIDGLEKTNTPEIRRKIVIDESSRIQQIRINAIFILPIELMKERQLLRQVTEFVYTFPNVKIQTRKNEDISAALVRLTEMIYKRIPKKLFADNAEDELVCDAIRYSGGNPRELLRILSYANVYADEDAGMITAESMQKGLQKFANETVQYITAKEWKKLKELYQANKLNGTLPYDEVMDGLLEKALVYEYNDGSYKRANPVITLSQAYHDIVLHDG